METIDKQSAVDFINQMFPTGHSNSGSKAREDLAAATRAVQELIYKMQEIKTKAEQSETMVQEICRDIKKLDFAKKHITTTITALHRLTMLVSAVEQLQVMASKRQYKEAAAQLEAVNQLCSHFEAYRDFPKITELREKFKSIKQILKSHVFSDFSSLGTGKESEETNLLQRLSDACLVVDALEPSVRKSWSRTFAAGSLLRHQIFEGAELAKLDKTERRYAWIKRRRPMRRFGKFSVFMACPISALHSVLQVDEALQRTLEFEEELAEKFGGGSRSKESGTDIGEDMVDNNNQTVSDIRKKYEKKLAANHGRHVFCFLVTVMRFLNYKLCSSLCQFNFRGIISSCFEAYLTVYVELEEKTLMEHLEKLVQEETWEIEEGSQTNVLSSSMQTSDKDERLICYIVNTAEYCHKTLVFHCRLRPLLLNSFLLQECGVLYLTKLYSFVRYQVNHILGVGLGELAENVSKIVDPQFADRIDMSEVQDEFSAVITKALITLVHGIETKFDTEMAAMTRVPWGTLESVGDQSEYVNGINTILTASIPVLGRLLSPIYFQFFLDKMLLDTQAVKTILLEIPSLAKQTSAAAAYSKFVSREMSKAEALLKVILSPVDSVADTYCALLPEGPQKDRPAKHTRRLQQTWSRTYQPSMKPVVPAAPVTATQSTPAGIIPLKEELVARAAALGRGAATTGIRRILALTESTTKDRKDGPLRKLFIG
ncbi:UNVERIFIED_CONTAM: Vacuolar protein sorting-associated protein 53 A [Sesamum radiatum]|uniref:Vacuolar protein sorting-associated protein 53 A n=1 Tax=Sesamum radiatum TaxID=300843 RepID=A0AAW2K980_SESRA